jgi:hypothetical protein
MGDSVLIFLYILGLGYRGFGFVFFVYRIKVLYRVGLVVRGVGDYVGCRGGILGLYATPGRKRRLS